MQEVMTMKETYVKAEVEIIFLANNDMITTSSEYSYNSKYLDDQNNNVWIW